MPLITWGPSYAVGIESIDLQHKSLFAMADALDAAIGDGKASAAHADLIGNLKDYALEHFSDEEEYMEKCGYPDIEAHKVEHIEFVRKVAQFDRSCREGTCSDPSEVLAFLADWLKKHVMTSDMRYAKYCR